jgi:PAS domain S-box-containing protein
MSATLVLLAVLAGGAGALLAREAARRRRAQRELARVHDLYRSVLSHFPDGVIAIMDRDLRFLLAEGEALERLNLSKEALEGRTIWETLPPAIVEQRLPAYRAALAGEGSVATVVNNGRHLQARLVPLRDAAGQVTAIMSMSLDVTDAREREAVILRLNSDLERSVAELTAANQELEAFSYSVSHDLRAPLRHVSGFVDLLRRGSAEKLDAKGQRQLETIARAARTMGQLIDDLLAFSRVSRTRPVREPVDMGFLVREIVQPIRLEAAGRIEWQIHDLPQVAADPALMRIVLNNLIGNAVKYSRNRERARIEVGSTTSADAPPGQVVLYVRDNGVGFDMEYAGKLFGVFQRLHRADEFEGTGIGLATVRRIVSRHGGRTWAEGQPGEGATFYFSLPLAEGGALPDDATDVERSA